jgi:hypothetical protein
MPDERASVRKPAVVERRAAKAHPGAERVANGHRWRRKRGAKGWCRASSDYDGDFLNPEITNELDSYTKKHLPRDVNLDGYPSLLVDDPTVHQTSKGNFGEVVSDHMLSKKYDNLGGITRTENPDRRPGIGNVRRPRVREHFDYKISETKFIHGFDGDHLKTD